jgi:hypothetical protein
MSSSTGLEIVKSAKKIHRCSWCANKIEVGESYKKYRYFDGGDAGTVKLHPECYDAMKECDDLDDQFSPGDNPRGCNCGHCQGCERCAKFAAAIGEQLNEGPAKLN